MGRGSGADAGAAVVARKPARLTDGENTTFTTLWNLQQGQPEADGFTLKEIADAGLPELSPEQREGFYRTIVETADGLLEKGLAECSSDTEPPDLVRWKLSEEGEHLAGAVLYLAWTDKQRAAGLPTL